MKKGFTLLEVLGSILILAGLISVVSQVTYGSFKRIEKSKIIQKVTFLLQEKMSEIEFEYKNKNIFNLPSENKGDFEDEANYLWRYEVRALEMPSTLTLLSLQGLPQSDMNIKVANLVKEVFTNTVVELKLTVTYTKSKQDVDYSLVSYFVNYDDIPVYLQKTLPQLIPGGGSALQEDSSL